VIVLPDHYLDGFTSTHDSFSSFVFFSGTHPNLFSACKPFSEVVLLLVHHYMKVLLAFWTSIQGPRHY